MIWLWVLLCVLAVPLGYSWGRHFARLWRARDPMDVVPKLHGLPSADLKPGSKSPWANPKSVGPHKRGPYDDSPWARDQEFASEREPMVWEEDEAASMTDEQWARTRKALMESKLAPVPTIQTAPSRTHVMDHRLDALPYYQLAKDLQDVPSYSGPLPPEPCDSDPGDEQPYEVVPIEIVPTPLPRTQDVDHRRPLRAVCLNGAQPNEILEIYALDYPEVVLGRVRRVVAHRKLVIGELIEVVE